MQGQPCMQSNEQAKLHRRNGAPSSPLRVYTGRCHQSTFCSCHMNSLSKLSAAGAPPGATATGGAFPVDMIPRGRSADDEGRQQR